MQVKTDCQLRELALKKLTLSFKHYYNGSIADALRKWKEEIKKYKNRDPVPLAEALKGLVAKKVKKPAF